MEIRLGPWMVSVVLEDSEDLEGDYGDWDLATKVIRVRKDLGGLEMSMTLIHEMTHAISDLHHLRLTEQSVRAIENSVTQLIQSYPDLCKLLVEAISLDSDPRRSSSSGGGGEYLHPSSVSPRASGKASGS